MFLGSGNARAFPVLDGARRDTQWPDLTNAVHWLVDDTPWDVVDPVTSIGTILRDDYEADAIREAVAAVVAGGLTDQALDLADPSLTPVSRSMFYALWDSSTDK